MLTASHSGSIAGNFIRKKKGYADYIQNSDSFKCLSRKATFDINKELGINSDNSFLIRVSGESMKNAGISTGNTLVVNRSMRPRLRDIVVASINNELTVKRLYFDDSGVVLMPENPDYEPIKVKRTDKLDIWGVVTTVLKDV
ncbi:MAG: LexA family protein [Candidatus Kapaibacterium sp.]